MGYDTAALAAIHFAGVLGALLGAWRGAPMWKAALVVTAFMAAGFFIPVPRSWFRLIEHWVASVFLISLAAAWLTAHLLNVRALILARILFVSLLSMAFTASSVA